MVQLFVSDCPFYFAGVKATSYYIKGCREKHLLLMAFPEGHSRKPRLEVEPFMPRI